MKRTLPAPILILILAVLILTPPFAAHANGNNQVIFLTYLPEISNYGNKSATGIAVVDLHTGEVSVQAANLTLTANEHYEVWLTGPNLADPVHVAALPSDGHLPTVIVPDLPQQDYRYVLLTFEADGTTPTTPGGKQALAGVFPNAEAVAPVKGVGASGQPVTSEPPSAHLPNTGALLPDRWVQIGAIAVFVGMVIGFGARWVLSEKNHSGEAK